MTETQKKQAQITSLRLLAASPKSHRELSRKLSEKGFDRQVVAETLADLEKKGLLSDTRYAQNLVTSLTQDKLSGRNRVVFELKRHGIPQKVQDSILDSLDPKEEALRAREAGQSRWDRHKNLPSEKRKKRVYDFLVRKGFDFQLSRDTVEALELIS